ncbi:ABC transporter substrate-binding protein [Falsiroseomonas selenitidurans]|uniref:Thiamine pyrimidine synthase n=1 Tax=Falsiroseomonas selenitidurans TaxID=2716335 RepID=A0ABX1E520_9PROT|nr:ABC transporter substrate-binding protein [Falsiroseomonas selenitidurans]NKC32279.1 ABC transporter substrate-binding protein [Falsiroseomonas selenitidurans]
MQTTRRSVLTGAGIAAAGLLSTPRLARGQASLTPIKFSLDWAFQGPQAPYLLAAERGYFREEGLDVSLDRGFGAGDVPVKVASGAYQFGVGDVSAVMRLRLTQPGTDLICPFVLAQGSPLSAITLRRTGIRTPKDLEGKRLAAPETDGGRQFFPAFARATGIDTGKITWITVTPPLREPMLARGDADAITGFETSGVFSLRALGIPQADIVVMRYSSFGVALLSTGLQVRKSYAEANPRIVTGMIRAIIRGHADAAKDPDAAITALVKRDPTAPVALEKQRLIANFEFVRTPEVIAGGYGNLPLSRVQASIETIRTAFNIPATLAAADFYQPQYLPPASALAAPVMG